MVDFKKILLKPLMLVVLLLAFAACERTEEPAAPEYRITAAPADEAMTVDGLLNEAAWQSAQTVTLVENRSGMAVSDSAVQTQVKTCYTPATLYIAFICNDPDIWSTFTQRDEHLWEQEVVEVFLDSDREANTYVEIEVSPANVLFDSYIVDPFNIDVAATKQYDLAAIQTAVAVEGTLNQRDDRDQRWTVEIAIPVGEVQQDAAGVIPGQTEWRINFYRVNADSGGKSTGYAWSPTGARFHKPEVFGVVRFEE